MITLFVILGAVCMIGLSIYGWMNPKSPDDYEIRLFKDHHSTIMPYDFHLWKNGNCIREGKRLGQYSTLTGTRLRAYFCRAQDVRYHIISGRKLKIGRKIESVRDKVIEGPTIECPECGDDFVQTGDEFKCESCRKPRRWRKLLK